MRIRLLVSCLLCWFVPVVSHAFDDRTTTNRPNIIFIMLDDLDLVDVGAYGGLDIKTPNMDLLAAQGMQFTNYYANGPVCSPTRTAILTGRHPSQFGIQRAVVKDSFRGIPGDVLTLPQLLKSVGYQTAHVGKWHVGTNKPEFLPDAKGFDQSVRFVGKDYYRYDLVHNESRTVEHRNGQHLTEVLTDHAIDFIEESATRDKPFYLNLWYFAPHAPIQVPTNFDNSTTQYCLTGGEVSEECNEIHGGFAALVSFVDQQIGRLLTSLSKTGVSKQTLLIFASDNGGAAKYHPPQSERVLRGYKGSVFEGGIRVPMIVRWPGMVTAGSQNESVVVGFDFMPTLAEVVDISTAGLGLHGKSFFSTLKTGEPLIRNQVLYWENKASNSYFENRSGNYDTYAVKEGRWKLVFKPSMRIGGEDKVMLFDLASEFGEHLDLIGNQSTKSLDFLSYRFSISKNHTDNSSREAVQTSLQSRYYNWRRNLSQIHYKLNPIGENVKSEKDHWQFQGGVLTVPRNTLLDFHDGDFAFLTRITADVSNERATIAEKPGSWTLYIKENKLNLLMFDHKIEGKQLNLSAQLPDQNDTHIAFTVHGNRDNESTIKLYVNGVLADMRSHGNSISSVRSEDISGKPMLYIGNNQSGDAPLIGSMTAPVMSALSYSPSEVFYDYTNLE